MANWQCTRCNILIGMSRPVECPWCGAPSTAMRPMAGGRWARQVSGWLWRILLGILGLTARDLERAVARAHEAGDVAPGWARQMADQLPSAVSGRLGPFEGIAMSAWDYLRGQARASGPAASGGAQRMRIVPALISLLPAGAIVAVLGWGVLTAMCFIPTSPCFLPGFVAGHYVVWGWLACLLFAMACGAVNLLAWLPPVYEFRAIFAAEGDQEYQRLFGRLINLKVIQALGIGALLTPLVHTVVTLGGSQVVTGAGAIMVSLAAALLGVAWWLAFEIVFLFAARQVLRKALLEAITLAVQVYLRFRRGMAQPACKAME